MGRPLRYDLIEEMGLTTTQGSKLGKQVGFNKYLVLTGKDEPKYEDRIVVLSDKAEIVNDLHYEVLPLYVNGQAKPVTKILRNLVHTADGVYAYKFIDGKFVFADAGVSFVAEEETESEEPTAVVVDEPKAEEPKVEEPKVEEPKIEEPKEGEE